MNLPVISLWEPWGFWIEMGWKTIETRTHKRFAPVVGRTIGVHSSLSWDDNAIPMAKQWLSREQIQQTAEFCKTDWPGKLRFTVRVLAFQKLCAGYSEAALIDCAPVDGRYRYGLFLVGERTPLVPPLKLKGHQGLWYIDV